MRLLILKMKFECYILHGKRSVLNLMQNINNFVDRIDIFEFE